MTINQVESRQFQWHSALGALRRCWMAIGLWWAFFWFCVWACVAVFLLHFYGRPTNPRRKQVDLGPWRDRVHAESQP